MISRARAPATRARGVANSVLREQLAQGPAWASLGRLGTGQGSQLGLFLAVENLRNGWHRARLAAQHRLEAVLHQLLARPVNDGWAGFQSFDDPAVAPPFAAFRDISLQQNPRFQYPSRRDLSFPDQRFSSSSTNSNRWGTGTSMYSLRICRPGDKRRDRSHNRNMAGQRSTPDTARQLPPPALPL